MDKLVALCKNRGFIFAGSEIYGGLANSWDYGPLGVELLRNIKDAWWGKFVRECPMNVGLDSAILLNPRVWEASGHLSSFADPLMDCRACKSRHRADDLIEAWARENGVDVNPAEMEPETMQSFIAEHEIPCPRCGAHDFTEIRFFNLMYKTFQGVTEDSSATLYLRPETAQGIFINFANVQRTTRKKLPFGIAQIGKAFRNEITPGNFIFRTREFEQMELEFFCRPGEDDHWFDYWRSFCYDFLLSLGISRDHLRMHDHSSAELVFYSKATTDIEYLFPFDWGELWGIANRTDYDLTRHSEGCGKRQEYFDPETGEHILPYVIEPSVGVGRLALALLSDAYDEEKLEGGDTRTVLRLHPAVAPFKAAVLPLSKKLGEKAREVYTALSKLFPVDYDETGSIGKRYRREDEIGTPYCVTVDFQTVGDGESPADNCVTVRARDEMTQERVPIDALPSYFAGKLSL